MTGAISKAEQRLIDRLVQRYGELSPQVSLFRDQLMLALNSASSLSPAVHSLRSRLKDPEHLRDKLRRKVLKCREKRVPFGIDAENLLLTVNDLVGVRILHLHTRQFQSIDSALRGIFTENHYELLEGPFARTWDDESRSFFRECGVVTQESPSLYTSVHYVVSSASRTKVTAEIQVRTLMEEVWGEVDHSLNYPAETDSLACREQLKVLARVTSSASRLVDSIFLTTAAHRDSGANSKRPRRAR